jgi:hypothetical protein
VSPIWFHCVECGSKVREWPAAPADRVCNLCKLMSKIPDPDERAEVRRSLEQSAAEIGVGRMRIAKSGRKP